MKFIHERILKEQEEAEARIPKATPRPSTTDYPEVHLTRKWMSFTGNLSKNYPPVLNGGWMPVVIQRLASSDGHRRIRLWITRSPTEFILNILLLFFSCGAPSTQVTAVQSFMWARLVNMAHWINCRHLKVCLYSFFIFSKGWLLSSMADGIKHVRPMSFPERLQSPS